MPLYLQKLTSLPSGTTHTELRKEHWVVRRASRSATHRVAIEGGRRPDQEPAVSACPVGDQQPTCPQGSSGELRFGSSLLRLRPLFSTRPFYTAVVTEMFH